MSCTACSSPETRRYLRCAAGEILKCRRCHLVFLSQEGRVDDLGTLYGEDYFTERADYFFHDGVVGGNGHESPHVTDFRAGLEILERHDPGRGRLLDVGCATGSFLRLASSHGWTCSGVEVSTFAARKAAEIDGVEVFNGPFADAPFAEDTFDVITMWDLLEHLPEPPPALRQARRILKPGGLILVNAPNENSLLRKISRAFYWGSGGLIRKPVDRLYHQFHYSYFSPATLSLFFQEAGFEIVALETKPIPISRGRIPAAAKLAIQALAVLERAFHAEFELLLLGRKPAGHGETVQ
ncbi:MAG: class I SAM-dependent methyltransferase [Acidobacteriota bacterium]|jgi:2-polyprenyl-3-methyl-5-hydroxy-6-metoxy-1,4-benzoquinol methylase